MDWIRSMGQKYNEQKKKKINKKASFMYTRNLESVCVCVCCYRSAFARSEFARIRT